MAKAAKRQFLVNITPVPGTGGPTITGYFAQKTGGATTANMVKVFDGGNATPFVLPGIPETANLTVSRPYDPLQDSPILAQLKAMGANGASWIGRYQAQITVQPTDANYTPIGTRETYTGILAGITPAEVDASSGEAAMFSLEFSIATVA